MWPQQRWPRIPDSSDGLERCMMHAPVSATKDVGGERSAEGIDGVCVSNSRHGCGSGTHWTMFPTFCRRRNDPVVNDPLKELMGFASVIPGTDVVVGSEETFGDKMGGEPAPSVLLVRATVAVCVLPGLKVSYVAVD
jgi:hypothetical protein